MHEYVYIHMQYMMYIYDVYVSIHTFMYMFNVYAHMYVYVYIYACRNRQQKLYSMSTIMMFAL